MGVTVRIPTPLRKLTKDQADVQVEGATIGAMFDNMEAQYPGIKERLMDENGELRRFVNVYVNEEDIRFLDGVKTPLKAGDSVAVVPAIAGGR
jgi:molybdopterin synthase sulfur carrier subunit